MSKIREGIKKMFEDSSDSNYDLNSEEFKSDLINGKIKPSRVKVLTRDYPGTSGFSKTPDFYIENPSFMKNKSYTRNVYFKVTGIVSKGISSLKDLYYDQLGDAGFANYLFKGANRSSSGLKRVSRGVYDLGDLGVIIDSIQSYDGNILTIVPKF